MHINPDLKYLPERRVMEADHHFGDEGAKASYSPELEPWWMKWYHNRDFCLGQGVQWLADKVGLYLCSATATCANLFKSLSWGSFLLLKQGSWYLPSVTIVAYWTSPNIVVWNNNFHMLWMLRRESGQGVSKMAYLPFTSGHLVS